MWIKVNDLEDTPVRCILYQTTPPIIKEESDSYEMEQTGDDLSELPPRDWKFSFNEPMFEEQRDELYMLPRSALPEIIVNERRHTVAAAEYKISMEEINDLILKYSEWKSKREQALFSN